MIKHRQHGFTVVELIVIIVVIAILVTVSAVAYRSTQADSRDQKRSADALMLKAAVDDYYADNGSYPMPSTQCPAPGDGVQCWRNEVWQLLVDQGYLARIPQPNTTAWLHTYNVNGGNSNYGWYRASATGASYAIYIPLETHPNRHCKIGRNMTASWFYSAPTCTF